MPACASRGKQRSTVERTTSRDCLFAIGCDEDTRARQAGESKLEQPPQIALTPHSPSCARRATAPAAPAATRSTDAPRPPLSAPCAACARPRRPRGAAAQMCAHRIACACASLAAARLKAPRAHLWITPHGLRADNQGSAGGRRGSTGAQAPAGSIRVSDIMSDSPTRFCRTVRGHDRLVVWMMKGAHRSVGRSSYDAAPDKQATSR